MRRQGFRFVLSAFLLFALIVGFTGCGKKEPDMSAYEKIQKQLMSMTTYKSKATVEYISNKGSNIYETIHYAKISGEYRVEVVGPENVAGNITFSDTKTICQFNTRIEGKVSLGTKESMERSEIFVTAFLKNYNKSQEVSISVSGMNNEPCTVLEAVIPGEHPYLRSEKLWVDNKTLKPVKLIIYDPDGGERIKVSFTEFEYNAEFSELIFKVI